MKDGRLSSTFLRGTAKLGQMIVFTNDYTSADCATRLESPRGQPNLSLAQRDL
jgi:hypothetical protein